MMSFATHLLAVMACAALGVIALALVTCAE